MAYWSEGWRERNWNELKADSQFDIIVIGGGITGAGIVREAARAGARVLLVEQSDFAEGTSSRSSKLVHGGLRYLAQYKFGLTNDSVKGREELLRDAPGLVEPQRFVVPCYDTHGLSKSQLRAGLRVYDLMSCKRDHKTLSVADTNLLAPKIDQFGLNGGLSYTDAKTDDCRLVFRLIQEAAAEGALAFNYVSAAELIKQNNRVTGVELQDRVSGEKITVTANAVVNATGVLADKLRKENGQSAKMRPVRGSHLVFPFWAFPVAQAISFSDPDEPKRPMFAYPWQGVTVLGTTDLDHEGDLNFEPKITAEEISSLMSGVQLAMPGLNLSLDHVISSYAGVRPLVDNGAEESFEESRHHEVWNEYGLITVTGGKLTTFRLTALDALSEINKQLEDNDLDSFKLNKKLSVFNKAKALSRPLEAAIEKRLTGRYGNAAERIINEVESSELSFIPNTETLWAEVRWAARHEAVESLADLLLHRTRLGLLLGQGGAEYKEQFQAICADELSWSDKRWEKEWQAYSKRWKLFYSLPPRDTIPDWKIKAEKARAERRAQ